GSRPDAAAYLRRLEDAVVRTCADLGVAATRREDVQTGVWVGDDKICAIGVRLMRTRVTLHGVALNCDTDLAWFGGIVRCGLPDHGPTWLTEQLDRPVTVEDAMPVAVRRLGEVFELAFDPAPTEVERAFAATADVS